VPRRRHPVERGRRQSRDGALVLPGRYGGDFDRFDFPGSTKSGAPTTYYSFRYGNVGFVALDFGGSSTLPISGLDEAGGLLDYLELKR
jgi:hypothetical protein